MGTTASTPGSARTRACSSTLMPLVLKTNPSEMRTRSVSSRSAVVPLVQVVTMMLTPTMSAPAVKPSR